MNKVFVLVLFATAFIFGCKEEDGFGNNRFGLRNKLFTTGEEIKEDNIFPVTISIEATSTFKHPAILGLELLDVNGVPQYQAIIPWKKVYHDNFSVSPSKPFLETLEIDEILWSRPIDSSIPDTKLLDIAESGSYQLRVFLEVIESSGSEFIYSDQVPVRIE